MWVPSHVGIEGNETADRIAKEAARRPAKFIPIPFRDWYSLVRRKLNGVWKREWQAESRTLRRIKANPGK